MLLETKLVVHKECIVKAQDTPGLSALSHLPVVILPVLCTALWFVECCQAIHSLAPFGITAIKQQRVKHSWALLCSYYSESSLVNLFHIYTHCLHLLNFKHFTFLFTSFFQVFCTVRYVLPLIFMLFVHICRCTLSFCVLINEYDAW